MIDQLVFKSHYNFAVVSWSIQSLWVVQGISDWAVPATITDRRMFHERRCPKSEDCFHTDQQSFDEFWYSGVECRCKNKGYLPFGLCVIPVIYTALLSYFDMVPTPFLYMVNSGFSEHWRYEKADYPLRVFRVVRRFLNWAWTLIGPMFDKLVRTCEGSRRGVNYLTGPHNDGYCWLSVFNGSSFIILIKLRIHLQLRYASSCPLLKST